MRITEKDVGRIVRCVSARYGPEIPDMRDCIGKRVRIVAIAGDIVYITRPDWSATRIAASSIENFAWSINDFEPVSSIQDVDEQDFISILNRI